ncbi:glycosidase [Spirochaetia bacterium]|nr:glycosidase [Spirochaetia bacterium]
MMRDPIAPIALNRLIEPDLQPDYARLVLRPFVPTADRIRHVADRVAALPEDTIQLELEQVIAGFSADHGDLIGNFREHLAMAEELEDCSLSPAGRLLVGAYFTMEYAFEATALFNPSIVEAPDNAETLRDAEIQRGAESLRFIMSTRSVGEGHISSISFRTGMIDAAGLLSIDPVGRTAELGACHTNGVETILFRKETRLSERLLFPVSAEEQNGIEDARFVRFINDDGSVCYYATYTAYDGKNILPKLIATTDFLQFRIQNLGGVMAVNKGMALFPRKINGRYAMLSRVDGESIFIMFSDDLLVWNEAEKIVSPQYPWEYTQIGNCGSPLETAEGWLVLTHGVGSLRRYSIGALLLDKADPSQVIGRLAEPLISPGERERTGYVPNVVYTCGSIIRNGRLVIPYGSADRSIAFITVDVGELLETIYSI